MPLYDGVCQSCGHEQEIEKSMSVDFPVRCPGCRKKKFVQDWSKPKSLILRDGTPTTVGQQAERNAKEMGKELAARKADELLGEKGAARKKAPAPWWRKPGDKPLDLSRVKDTRRYIDTGEKD